MDHDKVLVDIKDNIALITINRPEVRNALDYETWRILQKTFLELDADPDVYVIMVTGAGDKAFVAGADLNSLKVRSAVTTFNGESPRIVTSIEQVSKPTIAIINGFALGGGLELAMACDIRIAGKKAKLGQTEINVGILPGAGGTQRLTRLVGTAKAKEMIFTGKIISAEEAEKIGLVNLVVEQEDLMQAAWSMAGEIAAKSQITLQVAKQVINQGAETDLSTGLMIEKLGQSFVFGTEDHLEGICAFLDKRKPSFKNK
ncbi:MAG: enoyl-CoA hydratase/isomerase family protein [Acidaminococcaceae bacterium]